MSTDNDIKAYWFDRTNELVLQIMKQQEIINNLTADKDKLDKPSKGKTTVDV